ncbi:MAG: gamma-aminobutyrate dehydratase [Chloroflexi bacterium]|nr:gamma-aminobutyrate dehydratase [Chloroflexota bacterium]MCZ7575534.1 gamma-aminobutyrate dehydratase [Dehalococcoidia bacterium]NJD65197.1 gamma-aminobutyrate dehydratase [Chloroflexota bacterium]PWB45389.1 MAG: gamma-aminobutyrate dehydratase [Dehalococcoidia bacterium]
MGLRTPQQYIDSLKDNRTVYYRGEQVPDVTTHPVIEKAVHHACLDFEMAEDPAYRDLSVVTEGGDTYSRYFKIPANNDDLLKRSQLIEAATALGKTLVVLVKEIGTDALFALHRVSRQVDRKYETDYHQRVEAFYRHCRDNDLAISVAQTDVKGDRSAGPLNQPDPDMYTRIVERRPDGIVVRGAKIHTSCTTNVNEVIVLPTRAMSEADKDYALAFAIPVDTPGLKLVASPYGGSAKSEFDAPLSAERKMMETITIFDDVFVPWERVFLAGEHDFAGALALGFVEYHRFTAVSYKLPLVDALIGSALLMADMNGISKAAHVRDKLIWLISYAETLRALTEMAAIRGAADEHGIFAPDALTTNMAKYHFAHNYHEALQHVQDIAGGMLVTGPGVEDFASPETGDLLRKYLAGRAGVDGEARTRAMNMVSDLTTGDFGGYHAVLAIHAEGSLEAEKLMISRAYDGRRTLEYARKLAGLA